MKKDQTRLVINRNDKIGAPAAENDTELLDRCFIDTGDLEILLDCDRPESIVSGRTGSGKSALLWYLSSSQERVIPISAENLALRYISNSTILSFVLKLGLQLDPFFKLLWRHVFVVEIIKKRFNLVEDTIRRGIVENLREIFLRKNQRRALEYVRRYENTFWQDTDCRIREVTGKFEEQLQDEIKLAVPSFDIRSSDTTKLTEEEKYQITQRAENVLNELQVRELGEIMAALPEIILDPQKRYYIAIDRLDENWVDERIKYLLIRALIETVKDFASIKNVKIIISMRTDLIEKVLRETRDNGFQGEKYESLYLNLRWSKGELAKLLDRRIENAFQRISSKIKTSNLIREKMGRQKAIDYMIERTLMRPRDLILYFNECLKHSVDKVTITARAIREAEGDFSRKRLESLGEEWTTCYPGLVRYAKILRKRPHVFNISDISDDECLELAVDNYAEGNDPLSIMSKQLFDEKITSRTFLLELMYIFYRVGLIGVKTDGYESVQWAHDDRSINSADLPNDFRVFIHKCFWRVLGVTGEVTTASM